MLQRLQSVYLALAALFCIVFLFVDSIEQNDVYSSALDHTPLLVLSIISAVVGLADVFLYRNRPLQINICRFNLLLLLAMIGIAFYLEYLDKDFSPWMGMAIPFLALALNLMAIRGIRADENLVRSMDRLR